MRGVHATRKVPVCEFGRIWCKVRVRVRVTVRITVRVTVRGDIDATYCTNIA